MRISDWSSDVCSSDLPYSAAARNNNPTILAAPPARPSLVTGAPPPVMAEAAANPRKSFGLASKGEADHFLKGKGGLAAAFGEGGTTPRCIAVRSEEHTSELQSLMRISYAVFCLNKKKLMKRTIKRY